MFKWVTILAGALRSALRCQQARAAGNLALRQQLTVLKHRRPQPRLTNADRLFWVLLSKVWSSWRASLHILQPETVLRWHRQGFRCYWRWKSRGPGRPRIDPEIWNLIRRMCRANPLWGAPRIHGELLKLGIDSSEAIVANYMIRHRGPPSQNGAPFFRTTAGSLRSRALAACITNTCGRQLEMLQMNKKEGHEVKIYRALRDGLTNDYVDNLPRYDEGPVKSFLQMQLD